MVGRFFFKCYMDSLFPFCSKLCINHYLQEGFWWFWSVVECSGVSRVIFFLDPVLISILQNFERFLSNFDNLPNPVKTVLTTKALNHLKCLQPRIIYQMNRTKNVKTTINKRVTWLPSSGWCQCSCVMVPLSLTLCDCSYPRVLSLTNVTLGPRLQSPALPTQRVTTRQSF